MGSASESSPHNRVSRVRARTPLAWSSEPDDSLTATMLGRSWSFSSVSGSVFVPVRPGTL